MIEKEDVVLLTLTTKQAAAVGKALDLYERMSMGQLEELAYLVRCQEIQPANSTNLYDVADEVEHSMAAAKRALGHPMGGSFGIFHDRVSLTAKRCYEIQKVLDQALALNKNPSPGFRGVNYDGLWTRLTSDKAPVCVIEKGVA